MKVNFVGVNSYSLYRKVHFGGNKKIQDTFDCCNNDQKDDCFCSKHEDLDMSKILAKAERLRAMAPEIFEELIYGDGEVFRRGDSRGLGFYVEDFDESVFDEPNPPFQEDILFLEGQVENQKNNPIGKFINSIKKMFKKF